jgi:hypothetical protein
MKKGEYHYSPRGKAYRIYVCTEASAFGSSSEPVPGEPAYYDREAARRRVYELNGWKYDERPRNKA